MRFVVRRCIHSSSGKARYAVIASKSRWRNFTASVYIGLHFVLNRSSARLAESALAV